LGAIVATERQLKAGLLERGIYELNNGKGRDRRERVLVDQAI